MFAVPGHPLDPRAEGTNRLLKTGATMVTEPEDVIAALAPMLREPPTWQLREDPQRRRPRPGRRLSVRGGDRRTAPAGRARPGAGRHRRAGARPPGSAARAVQIALIELALAGRIERHGHQLVSLASEGQLPTSLE